MDRKDITDPINHPRYGNLADPQVWAEMERRLASWDKQLGWRLPQLERAGENPKYDAFAQNLFRYANSLTAAMQAADEAMNRQQTAVDTAAAASLRGPQQPHPQAGTGTPQPAPKRVRIEDLLEQPAPKRVRIEDLPLSPSTAAVAGLRHGGAGAGAGTGSTVDTTSYRAPATHGDPRHQGPGGTTAPQPAPGRR
ncbi:hypothetical protein [Micromonospora yangpuensis]|uniref:Uncharacterized protein n=1 Tax=Micromonospora yangpuensis TaxID=683228 RepID=A0A1C6V9B1_9ACTN|nr:hypothetical protein [Micromonospora yangpuensis]GGM21890.1 hypothetical protein GCM10012279_45290 [Micromonospora yangpuensis]SCL62855.1 hypothetical protein GA0070617_5040 [Micromonospora yangpuensis]